MSTEPTVKETRPVSMFLQLLPEEILLPENTNVRPWESKQGESEQELKDLNDLMSSIVEEGQIQPIRVAIIADAKEGEPKFKLIAGRRRHRAVMMFNLGLSDGQPPLRLEATVESPEFGEKPGKTLARQFRRAAHENILRKNISAMDFALNIAEVRSKFKWEGPDKTKKVADFFRVSAATISQYEKLLTLPVEIQAKLAANDLSKDDAFRLAGIAEKQGPEKAIEVANEAVAAGEQVETAAEMEEIMETSVTTAATGKKAAKKKGVAKKKAAARSATVKAAERAANPSGAAARNKKEILEFFGSLRGPVYGYPNGAVWMFVDKLDEFAAGKLSERALLSWFDKMVAGAPKGTADSVKKDEETGVAKKGAAKKK